MFTSLCWIAYVIFLSYKQVRRIPGWLCLSGLRLQHINEEEGTV